MFLNISVNEVKNLICILSSISRNTLFLQLFCDLILRSKEDGPTTITCCRFLKLRMVWRRFKRRFGGGSRDSLAEVRKTVWRRSRDGLAKVERRFGGGRETVWRRVEWRFGGGSKDGLAEVWETSFFLRRLESPLFSAKVRKTVWRRFGKECCKKRPGVEWTFRRKKKRKKGRKFSYKGESTVWREKNMVKREKMW